MDDEIKVVSQTQIIDVRWVTQVIDIVSQEIGVVTIINAGPVGPQGEPGEPAVPSITVESPGPITTWDIEHPYDHDPSVEIRDTTDRVCIAPTSFSPGVVHIDISPTNIRIKAKLTP